MNYNELTVPERDVESGFIIGGNYYFSILLKNGITEICFPLSSSNSLFCFKFKGLLDEKFFNGRGWIRNHTKKGDYELIIPPGRYGFFIGNDIKPQIIGAYSKIFWEKVMETKVLKTPWSDFPVFYSETGNKMPSVGIKKGNGGYFVSIGDTPERGLLNSVHLSRLGRDRLLAETEEFLKIFDEYENDDLLYSNIMLTIFYSNGICIDNDENCILASKSPRYYVSSAYWARDFIFWSLPVIEYFDKERAKSLIETVLEKYWKNKGIHALYLDGRILYEGFEMDQLSYYLLILRDAIRYKIMDEKRAIEMAMEILSLAEERRATGYHLYSTELNSSDDPVKYEYVTFNNVIFWYSLKEFAKAIEDGVKNSLLDLCERIRKDVMENMVKEGRFIYSTDLKGNYDFYDDPTGSILLFPYLGFIEIDSDIFRRTLEWVFSPENPYFIKGKYPGEGNRHVRHPWLHFYSTLILSGIDNDDMIRRMPLDRLLMCETIDENTGKCLTGIHFPGSSGFFIQSMLKKYGHGKA